MEMVNMRTNQNQNKQQQQLTHIDMSKLSQAELHSLSLSSATSFHHHHSSAFAGNLVTPTAGSCKQTSSRTRSGRRTGLRPPKPPPSSDDPHLAENKSIVKFLKDLVADNQNSNSLPNSQHADNTETKELTRKKRKRVKKPKGKVEGKGTELGGDDVATFDVDAVANADDVYSEELRKRTVGMESEEQGLGFLRGLEGQWCSRRKKRRIVDAGLFATVNALPTGWKLLLALRRRAGHFSVYCRRYISPSGQQFQSCKDADDYLKSYLGFSDANPPVEQSISRIQHTNHMVSENHAVSVCNVDGTNHDIVASSVLPGSSVSDACEKEVSLLMIDNLPEVQVQALFECRSCKINFDDIKAYKHHVFFIHNKTTRFISFDTSDGRGLTIMDEKYQCKFCNKLFQRRSDYDNHVRLHTRNHVQDSEKSPGHVTLQKNILSQTQDVLPSRFYKMDALLQIAENSFLDTSIAGHIDKVDGSSPPDQLNKGETSAASFGKELRQGCCPSKKTGVIADGSLDQDINKHNNNHIMANGSSVKNVGNPKSGINESVVCTSNSKHIEQDDMGNTGNNELVMDCGISKDKPNNDVLADPMHIGENIHQNGVAEQSLPSFPGFTAMQKGENKLSDARQEIDRVTEFEELRLDKQKPLGHSLMNGLGSSSLLEKSKDLANNATLEDMRTKSNVGLDPETVIRATGSRHRFMTICVWCRTEFNHETIDLETILDSVGFMCPPCKHKISGHWESGFSMNSYHF